VSDNAFYRLTLKRHAQSVLIEMGAVVRCARHRQVLMRTETQIEPNVAFNRAANWVRDDVGNFLPEDLREAIDEALNRAGKGKDSCPECVREGIA
jgi:hypothetical protein